MQSSNCFVNSTNYLNVYTVREVCHPSNYLVAICSGIFGAIGIPGNIFVLILISKKFSHRKCYEWLLFDFAFINLVLCSNGLFLQTEFILSFDGLGCQLAGFINHVFGILSFSIPPLISLNQCMVINNSYLVNTLFTKGNVVLMCLVTLLSALALSIPFAITDNLGLDETGLCDIQITTARAGYLVVCGFHTPVITSHIVSGYCTYKAVMSIRLHCKEVRSLFRSAISDESNQVVRSLSLYLAVPLICQLPGLITKTVQLFVIVDPWISRSMISPFFLASASYPYLTLYSFKEYKSRALKLIFCKYGGTTDISLRLNQTGSLNHLSEKNTNTKVTLF